MNRIAVDVGGTFTDLIVFNDNRFEVVKTPSSSIPERTVKESIKRVGQDYDSLVHATTVGTNALLTGRYGKVGLITTEGFRDVLEIGRQNRAEMYNLYFTRPKPLIPRYLRFEVEERVDANGKIEKRVKREDIARIIGKESGTLDGVVISFINSYLDPSNELEAAEAVRNVDPDLEVTLATDINREMREYERTSTAAVNAVLKPVMSRYITNLAKSVNNLLVMQSNGGFASPETALKSPASFVESGPSAGAIAVKYFSDKLGIKNAIGFDMGGTTAKASAIIDGNLEVTNEYEVAGKAHMGRMIRGSGYPVRLPFIDLSEVSGGGGTIAWRDIGGILHIGPMSAEAMPGPASYGLGGTEPTITDANLYLGRIPPVLAGGEIRLDVGLAEKALKRIGSDPVKTSKDMISLANDQMAKAIRIITIERGLDPSEFVVFAFGGAGPLHITEIMQDLNIREAIIPQYPGAFSALGLLVADYKHDFVSPFFKGREEEIFNRMEVEAFDILKMEGAEKKVVTRTADVRYAGQSFDLVVPYSEDVEDTFRAAYQKKYGYQMDGFDVEIINLRLSVTGIADKPIFERHSPADGTVPVVKGRRRVVFQNGTEETDVYERSSLRTGNSAMGPAIVESYDSTVLIPPGFSMRVDDYLDLVIKR